LVSENGSGIPNWRYSIGYTGDWTTAFITKDVEMPFPNSIFSVLGLFIISTMPDQLGAKTDWFPISVTVNWNLPKDGGSREFLLKIAAVNSRPISVKSGPEVSGCLVFDVETIK
jgi:hypothetical protein